MAARQFSVCFFLPSIPAQKADAAGVPLAVTHVVHQCLDTSI